MHKRAALDSGEDSLVEVELVSSFLVAEDKSASGSTKSLMCCSCNYICIRDGALMVSCSHKTCDMSHIYHEVSSYCISNLTELLEINLSCICRSTCNNHLRLALLSDCKNLIIIDKSVISYAVRHTVEILS